MTGFDRRTVLKAGLAATGGLALGLGAGAGRESGLGGAADRPDPGQGPRRPVGAWRSCPAATPWSASGTAATACRQARGRSPPGRPPGRVQPGVLGGGERPARPGAAPGLQHQQVGLRLPLDVATTTGSCGSATPASGFGKRELVLGGIPMNLHHNGGGLAFGPDGLLYASTGDGEVGDRAQSRTLARRQGPAADPRGRRPRGQPVRQPRLVDGAPQRGGHHLRPARHAVGQRVRREGDRRAQPDRARRQLRLAAASRAATATAASATRSPSGRRRRPARRPASPSRTAGPGSAPCAASASTPSCCAAPTRAASAGTSPAGSVGSGRSSGLRTGRSGSPRPTGTGARRQARATTGSSGSPSADRRVEAPDSSARCCPCDNGGVTPAATTTSPASATALRIGPFVVSPPVVLAPMAGITNQPFRTLCREYGGGLYVSEMITTRALVERDPETMRLIEFGPQESPRSLQLYGVDPARGPARRSR